MRVVLDTNVLIAAYATRGQCHDLLEHCLRAHTVVSSETLLAELSEKLTRKLKFSSEVAAELLALLRLRVELVDPLPLDPPACRDPDDDWVIATAVAGRCDCIVTGDRDLLVLEAARSIPIIQPAAFWRFESGS
ncbi:MAG TPA: putative toxin-antitoxin system toxin component, PIN family [Longimicrobium sp.]|nr:putative toxin-antitoxin system toxin component, PIN family [Longimicrobium sp.]